MAEWVDGIGVVTLPNGTKVRGRSLRTGLPDQQVPEFGVYIAGSRPELSVQWDWQWIRWPDFWLPRSRVDALNILRDAYERASTERVEIACFGGAGRTGTAIAAMAVFAGVAPKAAVQWTRQTYNRHAVETPWQRRWIKTLNSSEGLL